MNRVQKIMITGFIISTLASPTAIYADSRKNDNNERTERQENRQNFIQNIKQELKKDLMTGSPSGTVTPEQGNKKGNRKVEKAEAKNNLKHKAARIVDGTITAVETSGFTVTADGKTYTVTTDNKTTCIRHFWGKCQMSDLQVNDKVNVWGTFTDDTQTTVLARMIRDLSITKRKGVIIGEVTSKSTNSFVMKTVNRGTLTVFVTTSTKYIQRDQKTMTYADIQLGNRVRVRGEWDKTNSNITNVTEVKDFSVPARTGKDENEPTGTVTPAPTTSVTPTVTPTTAPSVTPTTEPTSTPTPTPTTIPAV